MGGPGGITADTGGMTSGAASLDYSAQQLRDVHSALVSTLNAVGDCWGGDEAGKAFAGNYVKPAMQALDAFKSLEVGIAGLAASAGSWADAYRSVDGVG